MLPKLLILQVVPLLYVNYLNCVVRRQERKVNVSGVEIQKNYNNGSLPVDLPKPSR